MSKHTATPYRIGKNGAIVSDEPVIGMSGSDAVDYYGGHCIAESVTPKNAAFIVTACNCHYDLLEALQMAAELVKTARQYFPRSIKDAATFKLEATNAAITAAIAKANAA